MLLLALLSSLALKEGVYTILNPLFSRKIVEIERFAFRAAILDECSNYLGSRSGLGGSAKNFFRPLPLEL